MLKIVKLLRDSAALNIQNTSDGITPYIKMRMWRWNRLINSDHWSNSSGEPQVCRVSVLPSAPITPYTRQHPEGAPVACQTDTGIFSSCLNLGMIPYCPSGPMIKHRTHPGRLFRTGFPETFYWVPVRSEAIFLLLTFGEITNTLTAVFPAYFTPVLTYLTPWNN